MRFDGRELLELIMSCLDSSFIIRWVGLAMLSTKAYRIVESGTRGKIANADRSIFPGELILEEEPLLFFTHSFGRSERISKTWCRDDTSRIPYLYT